MKISINALSHQSVPIEDHTFSNLRVGLSVKLDSMVHRIKNANSDICVVSFRLENFVIVETLTDGFGYTILAILLLFGCTSGPSLRFY